MLTLKKSTTRTARALNLLSSRIATIGPKSEKPALNGAGFLFGVSEGTETVARVSVMGSGADLSFAKASCLLHALV